jgi:hypothetical protein
MLAVKMAATAAVVVAASIIAERVGALVGAMVATLPVAAGPAYILLAIDHDASFIADSTLMSLAVHAPPVFSASPMYDPPSACRSFLRSPSPWQSGSSGYGRSEGSPGRSPACLRSML